MSLSERTFCTISVIINSFILPFVIMTLQSHMHIAPHALEYHVQYPEHSLQKCIPVRIGAQGEPISIGFSIPDVRFK